MRLSDFIAQYARPDLRRATVAGHVVSLKMLADAARPGITLAKVKRADVLRTLEGGTARGLSRATVAKHARYLCAAFAYAVRMGHIEDNPATSTGIKHRHRPKDWEHVSSADIQGLLMGLDNHELRAAIALARWAGCRINEALRVQWSHVDEKGGTILILPTPDDWGRCEEGTKGKRRVVPLDPRVRLHIGQRGADDDRVCGSLLYRDYRRLLHRVATWKGAPWHTLRKSCGMDWADKVPISTVADWMGHSVQVASQYYLRPHAAHFAAITGEILV